MKDLSMYYKVDKTESGRWVLIDTEENGEVFLYSTIYWTGKESVY
jgi:uncharacterized protein YegP (UPF0339 family)